MKEKKFAVLYSFVLKIEIDDSAAGHLRMPHVWADGVAVLLHGVCTCLPQDSRLQVEADVTDGVLRLLGEMPLPVSGGRIPSSPI